MQSVFQVTYLENNMTEERMTRRIKQLEGEKLFAEMQASKTQDSHKERSHLKHSLGGGEQRAEGASREVDGTSTTTGDVFARARGGELGRELCGMADTCGETTMSTLSNEETSW